MDDRVYVNRTLNLKKIKFIGLDMDHTLIRYNVEAFERLSHTVIKNKLVKNKGYPEPVKDLPFQSDLTIRGLVIDRKKGNLLKLNRHSAIRASYHGAKPIDYKTQQKLYHSTYIDLSDSNFMAIDTAFSLSLATIYSQIVEMKESNKTYTFPDFAVIADDVLNALDEAHRDGSLKNTVKADVASFIVKDPKVVEGLEKFKTHGKRIFIVTNSDYHYSKMLLDYAITPFLKNHKSWMDLFEIVIVSAQKPRFFYDNLSFLKVNPQDGSMTNVSEKLSSGIYQGGCSDVFTKDFGAQADEILYIGDHIYGDILRLKKDCGWRTAMVIEELGREIGIDKTAKPVSDEIENLMRKKEPFEDELTDLMTENVVKTTDNNLKRVEVLQEIIGKVDSEISARIKKHQSFYNTYWGQLMRALFMLAAVALSLRAGNEESYFAYQVDRYACVYMSRLSDLLELSPRTYFRAPRRPLAHEID